MRCNVINHHSAAGARRQDWAVSHPLLPASTWAFSPSPDVSPAFRFCPGEFALHEAIDLEFLYFTILNQNPPDSFSFSFSFFLVALGLRGSPRTFSGCGEPGHSWLRCTDFSLCWPLVLGSMGSSSCGSWALEHRLSSCGVWA